MKNGERNVKQDFQKEGSKNIHARHNFLSPKSFQSINEGNLSRARELGPSQAHILLSELME
jgi:hypothetical protein